MTDILDLLLSNPQIQQFLTSLGASAAKETGARVGKSVVSFLCQKIKEAKLFKDDKVKKTEKSLNELIAKGAETGITLGQNFWIDFLTFMFPEREVTIDKLDSAQFNYIANRILTGIEFEQLLLDAGYRLDRIRYMTYFQGQYSNIPHYFDLAATFEQEYFDNLLVARVVDCSVNSPHDFVNSLPSVVRDMNGAPNVKPAFLRDHDIIAIVMSDSLTTRQLTRLRQTIRTVQNSNEIFLPRLILFTNEELTSLLACTDQKERNKRVMKEFHDVRPFRGL